MSTDSYLCLLRITIKFKISRCPKKPLGGGHGWKWNRRWWDGVSEARSTDFKVKGSQGWNFGNVITLKAADWCILSVGKGLKNVHLRQGDYRIPMQQSSLFQTLDSKWNGSKSTIVSSTTPIQFIVIHGQPKKERNWRASHPQCRNHQRVTRDRVSIISKYFGVLLQELEHWTWWGVEPSFHSICFKFDSIIPPPSRYWESDFVIPPQWCHVDNNKVDVLDFFQIHPIKVNVGFSGPKVVEMMMVAFQHTIHLGPSCRSFQWPQEH